ncbi:MAG: phosphoesterase [Gammaproteobacteria bacterium]|nr:phosphoesterase [Gammaproteobacteria bacterium]
MMSPLNRRVAAATVAALLSVPVLCAAQTQSDPADNLPTATPIKHVILIIGENRTFDEVFGTYKPREGQHVWNLRSEGILNADGSPGPNFYKAQQWLATDTSGYSIHPGKTAPYAALEAISTSGTPASAPFTSAAAAQAVEPALPADYYPYLADGGSGLPSGTTIDPRFPGELPNGPFDITHYLSYDDYAGSPVHRFFQMWQQLDCNVAVATTGNPSGCQNDLFAWVEASTGAGSNGKPQPAGYDQPGHHEGPVAMGMYNAAQGDFPYFTRLANEYAVSDNYHQAVMGGTGANHLAIGYGTTIYYADANGNPATPPANQIENPDPQPGTNNFYSQDGYGGGSYVECADPAQPGVAAVRGYLSQLPYKVFNSGDCAPNAYYIVNNYNPGYLGNGQPAPLGPTDFTIPPSTQPNLGLLLSRGGVSWHYYGEGWNGGAETGEKSSYCNICNPFLYSTQIMTNPALRSNLEGIRDLYGDIRQGTLPAVSIVKPDGFLDGHPASSKGELLEGFARKIIDMIKANPSLWKDTAIMITADEGGGYYDSGYVQPIDFFGDGTRIPMIVVSPYSRHVGVVHTYDDHVSFDKFVEANWKVGTISRWSRDNLPDPVASREDPYVPRNSPAIGDMMDMFHFDHERDGDRD